MSAAGAADMEPVISPTSRKTGETWGTPSDAQGDMLKKFMIEK